MDRKLRVYIEVEEPDEAKSWEDSNWEYWHAQVDKSIRDGMEQFERRLKADVGNKNVYVEWDY